MSNSIYPQETKHAPIDPRPRPSHFTLAQRTKRRAMQCNASLGPCQERQKRPPSPNQTAITAAQPMLPPFFCQPRITLDPAGQIFPAHSISGLCT
ncbi:hypothetical protein V8C44DRAFT_334674 [Trichoderma aethiopicum]